MKDDNQALAADGDNQEQAGYESLLDDSGELEIPDPDALDESADDAPDEEAEEADASESDEQSAKAIADDAKVLINGREVTGRELIDSFSNYTRQRQADVEVAKEHIAKSEVAHRTYAADVEERAAAQIAFMAQRINDVALPGVDLNYITRLQESDPDTAGRLFLKLQLIDRVKQELLQEADTHWQKSVAERKQAAGKQAADLDAMRREAAQALASEKWWNADTRNKIASELTRNGLRADIAEQFDMLAPYPAAIALLKDGVRFREAQKQIKAAKQPSQQAQVPTSAKTREGSSKQKADALFAAARKTPTRAAKAKAYTSLLGG
jgi:hypothetical protein